MSSSSSEASTSLTRDSNDANFDATDEISSPCLPKSDWISKIIF